MKELMLKSFFFSSHLILCSVSRLKKCIAVGMSRDAVRFGRVPKKEKAKILEQMAKVNQQSQHMLLSSVLDQQPAQFVQKIIDAHLAICPFSQSKFAAFYEKAWSSPDFIDCPAHMVGGILDYMENTLTKRILTL